MSLSNAMLGQNKGIMGQMWPVGPKLDSPALGFARECVVIFVTKYSQEQEIFTGRGYLTDTVNHVFTPFFKRYSITFN